MKKIVVFNQKGGTGKTATTINIAGCLEKNFKKKVMVVDCDSQMNATSYLLTQEGISADKTIVDIVKGNASVEDVLIQVKFIIRKLKSSNIFLIPGSIGVDYENLEDILVFKKVLEPYEDEMDFCLFDCPANNTDFTEAALACADYVIVPALADTDSLGGLNLLVDTVNRIRNSSTNVNLKILGIFFNNVEIIYGLSRHIMAECKSNMEDLTFDTYIRHASAVGQARYFGKPINYYKSTAPVTQDFLNLTQELLDKIERMEK